jgi:hypothetical protein
MAYNAGQDTEHAVATTEKPQKTNQKKWTVNERT